MILLSVQRMSSIHYGKQWNTKRQRDQTEAVQNVPASRNLEEDMKAEDKYDVVRQSLKKELPRNHWKE